MTHMDHVLSGRPILSLAELEAFDPSAPARGCERRFCCPLPGCADKRRDGRHRSLSLNQETGQWHCHRCGAGGVLQERWAPREPRFNPRRASSRRAFALHEPQGSVSPMPEPQAEAARRRVPGGERRWRDLFEAAPLLAEGDPGAQYLRSRAIDLAVAQACGARYLQRWPHWERRSSGEWLVRSTSRRVVFPILDAAGQLVAIQGRAISSDEYGPKVITRGDLGAGVFRTSSSALEADELAIVEAPIDALSLASAGCEALAVCGTSIPEWLPPLLVFRRVRLGFDADEAGDRVSARAAAEFTSYGCMVERWRPPRKDWNEVLVTCGLEELRRANSSR
jgi:hypothetical protein